MYVNGMFVKFLLMVRRTTCFPVIITGVLYFDYFESGLLCGMPGA